MMRFNSKRLEQVVSEAVADLAERFWPLFILVALIGADEFITGPELSLGIAYLLPVLVAGWWCNLRRITIIGIACTVAWLIADLATGYAYAQASISFWNALTRLGVFLIVGFVVNRARDLQLRQLDLIGYVVHDLRTPLTVFESSTELMVAGMGDNVSQDVRECLDYCRCASQSMETLVNSILDLSRLEEGKMPLYIEPVRVGDSVRHAIRETFAYAQSKQIELQENGATDSDYVLSDPIILHRILVNLISNAVKVSCESSCILIQTKRHGDDEISVSVVDTGPGIPKEYVSRIFDKFVQVKLRKSGNPTGSGLGLAFCRMATLAQKGRIWAENAGHHGASIVMVLPAAQPV